MAYTTINKSSDYFNTKLYTGNGSTQSVTGVGFQPDWTWIKSRTTTNSHALYDVVRGATKTLKSNTTGAEVTSSQSLTSFDIDGFSVGSDGQENGSGRNYASWNWLASNTTASNTDGSITSTVSANTTSGFSIVKYVGNASAGATIGHGLGVVPKVMIVKSLSGAYNWGVYHASLGSHTKYLYLDATNAVATDSGNFDNVPTSSTFLVGSNNTVNKSGDNYIAYCFAEKKGFSKFGSYVGNGNADGTFVYTGFKPAMVIIKRTNTAANWVIFDNKRGAYNSNSPELQPNTSAAEAAVTDRFDFVSNGIKFRSSSYPNGSGNSFIYMAFAEAPLVGTNNIPCTAR